MKPPVGTHVVDTRTGRTGVVMGHEGPYVQLRPCGGGLEWDAEPDALLGLPPEERQHTAAATNTANTASTANAAATAGTASTADAAGTAGGTTVIGTGVLGAGFEEQHGAAAALAETPAENP